MTGAALPAAVLFDLDGTLLDTAPDMVAVLNLVCAEERQPPVDYALARNHVSHGSLGLLRVAFGELPAARRDRLQQRYLDLYARHLCEDTALFDGMAAVLDALEAAGAHWGVVTNKPAFLTDPLLDALGLSKRSACIVSGDTVARRKPHPDPLLHALTEIGAAPANAVYVGDAERDIAAGLAAGMGTIAATWGYIPPDEDPRGWGAHRLSAHPAELPAVLGQLARRD